MKRRALTRIVQWGHDLLAEVVDRGDFVVDLTAGNGNDTLVLSELVGEHGQVVALDIQLPALLATQERLAGGGVAVRLHEVPPADLKTLAGVDLLQQDHGNFAALLPTAPAAIIANLGYLPGGARDIITRPESTIRALTQACQVLVSGGRLAIVVYPGHPGGDEEGRAVEQFMATLDSSEFQVLLLQVSNRPQAPFLYVVEKLKLRG